ncbi:MAG: SprT-like domain-containing protein [candidate division Zixibacteria bacterium]|nr:SprT-like domain-containing protein [candidate division Zixibacteria bacterium]
MPKKSQIQTRAMRVLNYDLFEPEKITVPAPATLYTKINESARQQALVTPEELRPEMNELPDEKELARRFDMYNFVYFKGKLPRVRVIYSNRMTSAGSYSPNNRIIKIGRRYHEIFPEEINDTLKHEMIHILNLKHDQVFKKEAERIGASVKAQTHPALSRPPKYVYTCPRCGQEYPRQKRLRMASCGKCSRGGAYDERFKLKLIRSARKSLG